MKQEEGQEKKSIYKKKAKEKYFPDVSLSTPHTLCSELCTFCFAMETYADRGGTRCRCIARESLKSDLAVVCDVF